MDDTTTTILITGGVCLFIYWLIRKGFVSLYRRIKKPENVLKKSADKPPSKKAEPKQNNQSNNAAQSIVTVILFGGLLWYFFGGGLEKQAAKDMQNIQNQVAADSVAQYGIALRNGTAMDRCVQAGMVTAAFLQAQNEANYQKWKAVETKDCASAGVPR